MTPDNKSILGNVHTFPDKDDLSEEQVRKLLTPAYNKYSLPSCAESLAYDLDERECEDIKQRGIERISTNSSWEVCKKLSRQFHDKNKGDFKLYISQETKLKGKIAGKEYTHLKPLQMMRATSRYIKDSDERQHKLFFIDEEIDKRGKWIIDEAYTEGFWFYKFISGNNEYTLLTQEGDELQPDEYTITGTTISLPDLTEMSKYSRLLSNRNIILLHTATPRIPSIKTHNEFISKTTALKLHEGNNLQHFLFSKKGIYYPNPKEFEDLMTAVILSSKIDGYPLHFLGIGGAGCGKSTTLEGLHSKSGELSIFGSSSSTYKALIPSYKGTAVNLGHFLASNRFAFTDEFFKVLTRDENSNIEIQLTSFDDLLEHKQRFFGSGNCSITGQMTSKFIAVTNNMRGSGDLNNLLLNYKDAMSTFSRLLIFYYSTEHTKQIEQQKNNQGQIKCTATDKGDFLCVYDYLQSFSCIIPDNTAVRDIYNMAKERIQKSNENELILQLWGTRYRHHLDCLLDGIVKARCILEQDTSFTAKPQDYAMLKESVLFLLSSWNIGFIDEMRV